MMNFLGMVLLWFVSWTVVFFGGVMSLSFFCRVSIVFDVGGKRTLVDRWIDWGSMIIL